jgi:iron(III) transport system ATP-binding protein
MNSQSSGEELQTASQWGERGTVGPVFAGEIRWENISYSIGGKSILRDVSFSLKPGEIGCLLGPSGCGKSTLLRIAAGITAQTSGRIVLDGREAAGPEIFLPPEKRSIGLMFQDFALFPHLTVLENVMFGLYAISREQARRTAEQALQRVGLLRHAGHYPHMLSGGEQQRVALARTVVPRPQVILMDEPFSGLDPQLRWTIRNETLALLRETRATALIVTHDADEAVEMADHIVLMKTGEVAQQGTADELFNHPATPDIARYFTPMNEMTAVVQAQSVETPVGNFAIRGFAEGETVRIMLRPQSLFVDEGLKGQTGRVASVHRRGAVHAIHVQFPGVATLWTAHLQGDHFVRSGDDIQLGCRAGNIMAFKLEVGMPT